MKHDLKEQVALQHETVARLCEIISVINRKMAALFRSGAASEILDVAGRRSARQMEILGEILNGQDATDGSDAWMYDVFDEAHRLWPTEESEHDS